MFTLLGVGCLLALASAQIVPNPPRSVPMNGACNGQADCADSKMICQPTVSGSPNQCLCPANMPSVFGGSYCGAAPGDSCVNLNTLPVSNYQCNDYNSQCNPVGNGRNCICRAGYNTVTITSSTTVQPKTFCAPCSTQWITYTGWMIGAGVRLDYFEYTTPQACQAFCLSNPLCTAVDVQGALCWISTDPPATLDSNMAYSATTTHYRMTTGCASSQPGACLKVTATAATQLTTLPQNAILMQGMFNVPSDCYTACANQWSSCQQAIVDQRFIPLACYAVTSQTISNTPYIAGDNSFLSYTSITPDVSCGTSVCMSGAGAGWTQVQGPGTYNPTNYQAGYNNLQDCQTACIYSGVQPSTCAGVEVAQTSDQFGNQQFKCYFHTVASMSGVLVQPAFGSPFANTQIFRRTGLTCQAPCTNVWSTAITSTLSSTFASTAATLITDPSSSSPNGCQNYCSMNIAGCKAVEYGINQLTNQFQCYTYITQPSQPRYQFSLQTLLILCPGQGPCVQSTLWMKPNATAYGTVMNNPQVYASAATITDCQNACLNLTAPITTTAPSSPYCYGIELDSSYSPPVCRLYTNPSPSATASPNSKIVPSTIQQLMLQRVCSAAGNTIPTMTCDMWTSIDQKSSAPPLGSGGQQSKAIKLPSITDAGKCRDTCMRLYPHCMLAEMNLVCYLYIDSDWQASQSFEDTRYKVAVPNGPSLTAGSIYVPALPRCMQPACMPTWQSMPKVQSWGGTLAPSTANIRTASDCQAYCIVARGCVAVDVDFSSLSQVGCWLHFSDLKQLGTNMYTNANVTQYRLKRCPQNEAEYCTPAYQNNPTGLIVNPTANTVLTPTSGSPSGYTTITAAASRTECMVLCNILGVNCVGYSYTDPPAPTVVGQLPDLSGTIVSSSCNLYSNLTVLNVAIAFPAGIPAGTAPIKTDTLMTKTNGCAKYCLPAWNVTTNAKFGNNAQQDTNSMTAIDCVNACQNRIDCIAVAFDSVSSRLPTPVPSCTWLAVGADLTQVVTTCPTSNVYILLKKCAVDCQPPTLTPGTGRYKMISPNFYDWVVDLPTCTKMCNLDPFCNIMQFTTWRNNIGNPPVTYGCSTAEYYDPVPMPDVNPAGATSTITTQSFLIANFSRCVPISSTACTPLWANVNGFKSIDNPASKVIQPSSINTMQACQTACLLQPTCAGVEMGPLTGTITPVYCALHLCPQTTAFQASGSCTSMTTADTGTTVPLTYWTQSYVIRRCPPAQAVLPNRPVTPPTLNSIG